MSQIRNGLKMVLISTGLFIAGSMPIQAQTPSSAINIEQNNAQTDGNSLFANAKIYHDGIGVPTDLTKAHALYQQAAALGNNDARVNLGYMYFVGQGVLQNYKTARQYYLQAAKLGDVDAQRNLVLIYKHGLGVTANQHTAAYWKKLSEGKAKPARHKITHSIASKPQPDIVTKEYAAKSETVTIPAELGLGILPHETSHTVSQINSLMSYNLVSMSHVGIAAPDFAVGHVEANLSQNMVYMARWVSPSIASFLVILMIVSAIWFFVQLKHIHRAERQYIFAQLFFEAHRESLRGSFLRTPTSHQQFLFPSDPWAVSMCSLMVRFAITRHADPDIKCEPSKRIVAALTINPFEARMQTFPLVFMIQERLFTDIAYLNEEKLSPVKPFQFKARHLALNHMEQNPVAPKTSFISRKLRLVQ